MLKWIVFSIGIIGMDQAMKLASNAHLVGESVQLLPFLSFTHVCNTGAAFGMLSGFRWPLVAIGLLFVGYFSWEIRRETIEGSKQPILLLAYSLILAGAAGNVIDRLLHGCVTDFIFLHYWGWGFPVFNIADMAISIGAACWIWTLIRPRKNEAEVIND